MLSENYEPRYRNVILVCNLLLHAKGMESGTFYTEACKIVKISKILSKIN